MADKVNTLLDELLAAAEQTDEASQNKLSKMISRCEINSEWLSKKICYMDEKDLIGKIAKALFSIEVDSNMIVGQGSIERISNERLMLFRAEADQYLNHRRFHEWPAKLVAKIVEMI